MGRVAVTLLSDTKCCLHSDQFRSMLLVNTISSFPLSLLTTKTLVKLYIQINSSSNFLFLPLRSLKENKTNIWLREKKKNYISSLVSLN